jgi:hypothetical protein
MTHHKTSEEELERLANAECKYLDDKENYIKGYRAAEKAHQSQTELLRKRVEKLREAVASCCYCLAEIDNMPCDPCKALAGDKASGGVVVNETL